MDKKDLQRELDLLLAERLISGFIDGQKCIDWAITLMQRGYESENLYILAGSDNDEAISIEHYLNRLTDDLELEQNRNEDELFYTYVSDIARQVIDGGISPEKGLSVMEDIRIQTWDSDFAIDLFQFSDLAEDSSLIGEYQIFYIGLTEENRDEVIIQEMKMFLIAKEKGIQNIRDLIYCHKCKSLSQAEYIEKGWIVKKGDWYCKKCKSKDYLAWYKVTDRAQILKILENEGRAE